MSARLVEVRKYKWPDRWIDSGMETFLGDDEHGRWHAGPAGREIKNYDGKIVSISHTAVVVYPPGPWWCAWFNERIPDGIARARVTADGETRTFEWPAHDVYVHICLPPASDADGVLSFIDLELDVVRFPDGSVVVLDEDEFAAMDYPSSVAEGARAACDEVASMLRDQIEPFADAGARWLERFLGQEFGPVDDVK